jgi:hypothetical protein
LSCIVKIEVAMDIAYKLTDTNSVLHTCGLRKPCRCYEKHFLKRNTPISPGDNIKVTLCVCVCVGGGGGGERRVRRRIF